MEPWMCRDKQDILYTMVVVELVQVVQVEGEVATVDHKRHLDKVWEEG